jgi:D-xylose transport system permease protein
MCPTVITERNFVNLVVQMAGIATIAYGLVFVLLLGEIDLSVAYVSAVAGVGMTMALRAGWPGCWRGTAPSCCWWGARGRS